MSSKMWVLLVVLSPFLAPMAAHSAPLPDSQSSPKPDAPVPSKELPKPPKGAPGTGLEGPPNGALFEYATPSDFTSNEDWKGRTLLGARSLGGEVWLLRFMSENNSQGRAIARVRLPQGAKIRWFDCVLQGSYAKTTSNTNTTPGWVPATLAVTASLRHTRYSDHSETVLPHTLATVKLTKGSLEGDDELQLTKGVAIDHPRATVSGDGWYDVVVEMQLTGSDLHLGLRACRIGYLP